MKIPSGNSEKVVVMELSHLFKAFAAGSLEIATLQIIIMYFFVQLILQYSLYT